MVQGDAAAGVMRAGVRLRDALWRVCRRGAKAVLDVTLPTLCLNCREPVAGDGLCAACWSQLGFIEPPYCERLGIPFVYDPGPGLLSMQAIAAPPAYTRARAAVRYDEVARSLVHALKFHDRVELAPTMGRWMARAAAPLIADADLIVPVPLHWRRGFSRRYNQSGALALAISRACGRPLAGDVLRRIRPTAHQIGLSRAERAANVQGAFRVPPERASAVQGRRILLVDDVLTSGATADACARALLRAKAAAVDLVVFARVVDTPGSPI
ncbi:ComF family protein [Rhodopseudomonas faecalis]|uniref:ComF family protein n=2 Tax=Rhodopseudomonas faecalis TaxID=99655 RepID=A0A318TPH1_9BRAD|nr:ComF family protein [Rhodopseudomonas faecalis]